VRSPVSSVSRAFGETRRRLGREPTGSRLGSTGRPARCAANSCRSEAMTGCAGYSLRVDCQPVRATWVPAL
jgi:hypothetical protein